MPLLELAELVTPHHDLAPELGGGQERLHRGEAEELDEVFQVLRVGAVFDPREAVVAAAQEADPAPMHLLERLAGDLELAMIAHLLGALGRDAPLGRVAGGVDESRYAGG